MARPPRSGELTEAQRKIIEAAIDAFADQGYHGTATKEIARRAGVAEATIFKYFPSKKDLLVGVLGPAMQHLLAPAMARSLGPVFDAPHPTLEAFLRALVGERLAFVRAHSKLVRVLAQELPFHPELQRKFARPILDAFLPRGVAVVRRFQREGRLVDWPPETILRSVASVFIGYVVHRVFIAPEDGLDEQAEVDRMVSLLVRGLTPEPHARPRGRPAAGP